MSRIRLTKTMFLLAGLATASTVTAAVPTLATQTLLDTHSGLKAMFDGEKLVALYGAPMATEPNPAVSTEAFVETFVFSAPDRFGFAGVEIHPTVDSSRVFREGQFSVFTYHQVISSLANGDILPVHGSQLKLLVLRAPDGERKITYVGVHFVPPPDTDFPEDYVMDGPQAITIVSHAPQYEHLGSFTTPVKVVYEAPNRALHRVWRFFGFDADEEYLFLVDAATGTVVFANSSVLHADVAGNVLGDTTSHPLAQSYEQYLPALKVGLYQPQGPLSSCGVGNSAVESFADETGHFDFSGVTLPLRAKAVLESDVVTVTRSNFFLVSPVEACLDVETATDSALIDFDPIISSADELGTAAVNAFLAIHQSNAFWKLLQPASDAANTHVTCTVNLPGCGEAGFSSKFFATPAMGFYSDFGNACNNGSYATIVSHEYMHILQGQLFGYVAPEISALAEGTADVFANFGRALLFGRQSYQKLGGLRVQPRKRMCLQSPLQLRLRFGPGRRVLGYERQPH